MLLFAHFLCSPPFISEGGLFSAGPILLQALKPSEKFPLGILDPVQSSLQLLCQHQLYDGLDQTNQPHLEC